MNKQNLIKQLEHDLNNLGYKTYIYIDSQRFIIDDDILGMLLVIDLETTFITIYEWVDMKVIALVMQFKKTTGDSGRLELKFIPPLRIFGGGLVYLIYSTNQRCNWSDVLPPIYTKLV